MRVRGLREYYIACSTPPGGDARAAGSQAGLGKCEDAAIGKRGRCLSRLWRAIRATGDKTILTYNFRQNVPSDVPT